MRKQSGSVFLFLNRGFLNTALLHNTFSNTKEQRKQRFAGYDRLYILFLFVFFICVFYFFVRFGIFSRLN